MESGVWQLLLHNEKQKSSMQRPLVTLGWYQLKHHSQQPARYGCYNVVTSKAGNTRSVACAGVWKASARVWFQDVFESVYTYLYLAMLNSVAQNMLMSDIWNRIKCAFHLAARRKWLLFNRSSKAFIKNADPVRRTLWKFIDLLP